MTRVLIVDDHAGNLYLLRALLEGHGYVVEEARHGAEALTKARLNPPDVIVSDLLMPVLDGYTMLRHWRSDERLEGIPFIVYTATYTEPRDERLAMALGADAFIVKPAEPDVIVACVQDVLAKTARGELPSASRRPTEEQSLLRDYNEVLVRKIEKKALEAERVNRELRDEIAERSLAEERLRLRDRAIQEVTQGILITDPHQPDNPIIYASAGFERMTGYSASELIGRNCRFLQGRQTDQETVRVVREAVENGRAVSVEILNYKKDGTPFWNAVSINPMHDDAGAVTHFVGVQSDVTERRKLEDQLRQAQKMEAVGRLAGGVAHDFNNLLTIISGYSSLLLEVPGLGDADREAIAAISDAGERAATLTRQLLGFSRQTILQPRVLDLNAAIAPMGRMLGRLLGEDIRLTIVSAPDLSLVKLDPGQVDQVLMNLAVNARDAMPQGGTLTVETSNVMVSHDEAASEPDLGAGPHVLLTISDTGVGMTHAVMSRIFEPFFTTKDVGKGTGLGLSMVFGIVKQSGGCIRVQSEPGSGTTFKIYFPPLSEPATTMRDPHAAVGDRGTETILLVEDEPAVRVLATRSLRAHGYTVLTAADSRAALAFVDTHAGSIDLVLTDVVMPDLSGPEMVQRLRERHPDMRVLFMSGYSDDAMLRHGLLTAEVSFIQKPYTPVDLARKVRQVLDER